MLNLFAPRLKEATISFLNPPSRLRVSEWAVQNRMLSKEYSFAEGHFNFNRTPWSIEPCNDCHDTSVRSVVMEFARQLSKTTTTENVMGYHIDQDPSPMLMLQPTVEAAQVYSKERLSIMIRDMPCLANKIADAASRDSSNTIQLKTFPGGSLALQGANAPTGLGMRTRRILFLDEVDRYPQSAGTEGDPISIVTKTTETFPNSIIYLTSTPTIKGVSRIHLEYEKSDQRMWFVVCPHCGFEQVLDWPHVRWSKDNPEDAHVECANGRCEKPWTEPQRFKACSEGRWKATAPFKGIRGYHLNGINSLFRAKKGYKTKLHQAVVEYQEAIEAKRKGSIELLKTWTNCFLAEPWEVEQEKIDSVIIGSRAEDYSPNMLPKEAIIVIGGADVQKDRVEVEFQAVGLEEETWGIEAIKVYGDTEKPEVWSALTKAINRRFMRIDRVELRLTAMAIDTHYRPKEVREWCKKHGTGTYVYAVLGSTKDQVSLFVERYNKHHETKVYSLATNQLKDTIYARLKIAEKGPRYIHFPRGSGYTDEWYRQLTCERPTIKYVNGYPKRIYVKEDNDANEALDMRVYALGAFEILRPNLAVIKKLLDEEGSKPQGSNQPTQQQPARRPGGFIGGGFSIGGGFKI